MSIEKYVLHLYPSSWRARYEDEMLAMLEQCTPSFSDDVNLLYGVLDAHLHPHLGTNGLSPHTRMLQMIQTFRHSLMTIFGAYVGFILAGLAFQKLTEDNVFMEAAHTYSSIGTSFTLVVIGSLVALLGILAGGLPIVAAVIKHTLATKRLGQLLLLAVPIFALAAFFSTLFLLKEIHSTTPIATILSRSVFIGVILSDAIVSTGALCFVVERSEIAERFLRFALLSAMLAIASMILMLIATITWGLSMWSNMSQLFLQNDGLLGSSTIGTWIWIVVAMAMATALAIVSLIRGLSARSALSVTAA